MNDRQNNRTVGASYEKKAAEFLKLHGYHITEYNFKCRQGEIDIIAQDGEYICFVEVKYRANPAAGEAAEAVDARKQRKILRVAEYYLMKHGMDEWTPCRFDVVAVDGERITLYKNAFEAR